MTQDQKIIGTKVGLLELAKQLGKASQACKIMGYSRDRSYRFKELYETGGEEALPVGQLGEGHGPVLLGAGKRTAAFKMHRQRNALLRGALSRKTSAAKETNLLEATG